MVNFAGVRYVSSEVLGILAGLQREVDPARGSITLCGLDPLLRDMVRITHLDRVFDVCGDEAEALGLIAPLRGGTRSVPEPTRPAWRVDLAGHGDRSAA